MSRRSILLIATLIASVSTAALAQFSENEIRGFSPDKLYDLADVDAINTFNGNLTVTIPIGGQYPVNTTFSYGLTAVYNAQVWDFDEVFDGQSGEFVDFPVASELWNAGLGWVVGFGRLFPPEPAAGHSPINNTNQWLFIDPSGNRHHFYDLLHADDPDDGSATTFYSRDNSYLRLKLDSLSSPTSITMEFPDGRVYTFEEQGNEGWYPILLEDAFGNNVDIDYQTADPPGDSTDLTWVWTITDKHDSAGEREHEISLARDLVLDRYMVDSITLKGFGAVDAVYDFQYDNDPVETCYKRDPRSGSSTTPTLPLLSTIVLPESAGTYDFTDGSGDAKYHKIGCTSALPGALLGMRLPTRGQIEWDYGGYLFTVERMAPNGSVGVVARRVLDEAGNEEGEWIYKNETASYVEPPDDLQPRETRTHVTFPTGDCMLHYFDADPDPDWRYGLPFSTNEPLVAGLNISTELYSSSNASNQCSGTVIRTSYVEYEYDVASSGGNEGDIDLYNTNRRLLTTRTVYNDDNDRFAETAMADFDGVGNYRVVETSGDFPSGNARETITNYNPTLGTHNPGGDPDSPMDNFMPPAVGDPWVLGTFDARETTEGGSSAKELFCFEDPDGSAPEQRVLLWRRTLVGSQPGNNDLVSFFDYGTSGNVSEEFHYGGDTAVAPATGDCPLAIPGGESYRLDHRYQHGVLRRTEYIDAAGASLGFWAVDRDIDQSTGLTAASRDTAELNTTFTYDRLGRITRAEPESGQGARTDYTYTAAVGATPAQVFIAQVPNGGGAPLASSIVLFDGFGRVTGELRQLPSGSFNRRDTLYNPRGWKTAVSELELGTPTNFTTFVDYDPFGRPGRIIAPDGHEVILDYTGVSKIVRTVTIGFPGGTLLPSTTTEEFDRQGRLWRVTEPSGASGTSVLTTYSYDEGNRLASVSTDDGTTIQQRLFDYDGRGYLTSEQHPEKGVSGNGTVTYGDYDARGHVGQKVDGSNDLEFEYDRAERLIAVRDLSSSRMEKEFVYANDNDAPNDFRLGKLQRATRHNYLTAFSGVDVAISEVYSYGAVGGRVSKRVIERGDAGATPEPFFEQEFSWTELGDLEDLTYPSCVIADEAECTGNPGPSRVVEHTYTSGFLTGITDYTTSIAYHANEMIDEVEHTNGVTDHWDLDPSSMRRPARIHTTGVTGGSDFDTGAYAYDGAGNITAMGSDIFGYDGVSRLTSATAMGGQATETSGYDAFGNRTSANTATVGTRSIPIDPGTNRLIDSGLQMFDYDDRGNITAWWVEDADPIVTDEPTARLDLDPFDMIERFRVEAQDSSGQPSDELAYVYTADDERIATFPRRPSVSESWTLRNLEGRVIRQFFRSPTVDATWQKDTIHREAHVFATETDAGREDAHVDHLGTIRLWTSSGGPTHHTYSAFGEEIFDTQDGQVLRFTGHERDIHRFGECTGTTSVDDEVITEGETFISCDVLTSNNTTVSTTEAVRFVAGNRIELSEFTIESGADVAFELNAALSSGLQDLDYMRARFCSPVWGRFLRVDPSQGSAKPRLPTSWNRYSYALNNPIKYVDPDGKAWQAPEGASDFEIAVASALLSDPGLGPSGLAAGPKATVGILGKLVSKFPALKRLGNALGSLRPGGSRVRGLFGSVSRATLNEAAQSGGRTRTVVTRLTQAPEAGRSLSVASGDNAQALANAARETGELFSAEIPEALLDELTEAGLAIESVTEIGGTVAREIEFLPQATEFVVGFFQSVPK